MSIRQITSDFARNVPHLARLVSGAWSRVPRWPVLLLLLAIVCAFCVSLALLMVTDTRGNDDAGILWTYARNLIDGEGLVYRPGEYVEGYSSFSYVLLLAAGLWATRALGVLIGIGVDPKAIFWVSAVLNFSAWVAVIVIVYNFVKEELDEKVAAFVSLVLGACPAIAFWATSGMDTPFGLLSQVLIWVWVVRVDRRAGTANERAALIALSAAMVFSLLTRAEGFLWPMLGLVWLFGRHRRQALVVGAAFVSIAACYIGWRLWYYGYPLPNTYYAKMTGSLSERLNSAVYLQSRTVIFDAGLLIGVLGILAGLLSRLIESVQFPKSDRVRASDFEILAGIAWMGYFLYVGGDVYFERPMLILIPLGLVIAARLVHASLKSIGSVLLAGMLVLTLVLYPLWGYYRPLAAEHQGDGLENIGKFLKKNYPGSTVALNLAGKIAYYSGLPCIDMLGLCDEYVAHSEQKLPFKVGHTKRGFGYALNRKPELVIVCPQVFTGDTSQVVIDDDYTVEEMKSIGYMPILACNAADWSAVEKVAGKPLSEFSPDELCNLIARKKIDILIFHNPTPTGELPRRAHESATSGSARRP